MKKLLLILLCLPMIFSCGEEKTEKDDINELKNKINDLQQELSDCKEQLDSLVIEYEELWYENSLLDGPNDGDGGMDSGEEWYDENGQLIN